MSEPSLKSFLTLFEYRKQKSKETFEEGRIILTADTFKELDPSEFDNSLSFLHSRDKLQLSFIIGDNDPVDYYSGGITADFLAELTQKISNRDDEEIEITINISKSIFNGVVSIYDYEAFLGFLESTSLQGLLYIFNQGLKINQYLIFEFQTDEKPTTTSSIWFVNKGYTDLPVLLDRISKINKAKSACHYNLLAEFILLADDFFIEKSGCERLAKIFNLLAIVSSIVFLYDISIIKDTKIEYRLNGYKSINAEIDFLQIKPEQVSQYYKIYSWVYDSGNFNDKLGLARNIISLHLENVNSVELKGDPFQSIQSSYKIYEKQNIKQYIEIRNKISDQLLSFHDRANKIIETFATGFQKSALALITFYISAIALKILNKDKLIEVFTLDASVLSTAFIACSTIYFFVSRWEMNAQKKRFITNYKDLKKRYLDLLDSGDIQRILNNDHEFNSDVGFIEAKGKVYTIMWFLFITILLSTTWFLYFIYNTNNFTIILFTSYLNIHRYF